MILWGSLSCSYGQSVKQVSFIVPIAHHVGIANHVGVPHQTGMAHHAGIARRISGMHDKRCRPALAWVPFLRLKEIVLSPSPQQTLHMLWLMLNILAGSWTELCRSPREVCGIVLCSIRSTD